MDRVIERPAAAAPHNAIHQAEANREATIRARSRAKRIERVLDFAIMGTVGLVAGAAGLIRLIEAVSS